MVDEPDVGMDRAVADHIVGVHMRRDTAFNVPYTMAQVQNYVKFAKTKRPELSQQVLPRSLSRRAAVHVQSLSGCNARLQPALSIKLSPTGSNVRALWTARRC